MNDPLRYRGFTFYQSGFDNNDRNDHSAGGEESGDAPALHRLRTGGTRARCAVLNASVWFCEEEDTMKTTRPWIIVADGGGDSRLRHRAALSIRHVGGI